MSCYPDAPLILHGALVTGWSSDEFFSFCRANELLRLERTAAGEVAVLPPPGWATSARIGEVGYQLIRWNWQQRPGIAVGSSAAYQLPDGSIRAPSASWVSRADWQRVPAASRRKFLRLCPEFMVEVMSPIDHLADAQARMQQWLANGAQLGFLLTDQPETAYVYRPGQPLEVLAGFDRELSGELLPPGFQLDLRELREEES